MKKSTKGCCKEHCNPNLPARLGLTSLDKCLSIWYKYYEYYHNLNFSIINNLDGNTKRLEEWMNGGEWDE